MLPDDYKDVDNWNTFKNKVKKWKLENCPERFCEIYISNIDFVLERKKTWNLKVVFLELWLLRASIVLPPIRTCFFFCLLSNLFIAYWISKFLYLYRNQLINFLITITWLVSVWAVGMLSVWDSMGVLARYWLLKF